MANDSNPTDGTREFYSSPGSTAAVQLGPGARVNDRYVIERELGRGGIGVVYLARDDRLHSMPVVIKFLLDNSAQSAWLAKKFMQEAEALTRISHPGVVRVIDRDRTADGKPFFVMEFIKGRPLRSVMTPEGIDFEYAAMLIKQIGQALTAAHSQGVYHRDLKPENIMLEALSDGDEHIKLIDFGIAKVQDSQSGTTTDVGMVAGSLNYMAPEQLAGQPVTAASDIYSFGVIAYELVTGRRPFNPDSRSQVLAIQQLATWHREERVIPPQQLRSGISDAAQSVLIAAFAYDPAKRPQDPRHFGDELARALTDNKASYQPTVVAPTWPLDSTKASQIIPQQGTNPQEARLTQVDSSATSAPTKVDEPKQVTPATVQTTVPEAAAVTVPAAAAVPAVPTEKRTNLGMLVGLIVVLLAAVGTVAFFLLKPRPEPSPSSAGSTASVTTPAAAERSLVYSVTVRQDPKHHPDSKPFELPGEIIFSPGDFVRFSFSSPQAGNLYIVNESPAQKSGPTMFNVLFPSPTSNGGSAQLSSGQKVQIPERGEGFQLDAEEGVEKLWLIWSANAIPELDSLKRWANPEDKGEIKDQATVAALKDFIASHTTPAPEVKKDDESRKTTVSARSDLFIKLIKLEHHQ